jgi:hypothetical protein
VKDVAEGNVGQVLDGKTLGLRRHVRASTRGGDAVASTMGTGGQGKVREVRSEGVRQGGGFSGGNSPAPPRCNAVRRGERERYTVGALVVTTSRASSWE